MCNDWPGGSRRLPRGPGRALRRVAGGEGARPDRPSFIALRTIIGWPAPNKQNTGKAHGSALGADEVAATKRILGFDPAQSFVVAPDVLAHTRACVERGRAAARPRGRCASTRGRRPTPTGYALFDRMSTPSLPDGWTEALPMFPRRPEGHGHPQGVRAT